MIDADGIKAGLEDSLAYLDGDTSRGITWQYDKSESGDLYRATPAKWAEYGKARDDGDYEKTQYLEEGHDPDFQYAGT